MDRALRSIGCLSLGVLLAATGRAQGHSGPARAAHGGGEEAAPKRFAELVESLRHDPAALEELFRSGARTEAERRVAPTLNPNAPPPRVSGPTSVHESAAPTGGASVGATSGSPLTLLATRADYKSVDNLQQPWSNLNLTPYRPMAATSDNYHLYAVNVHGSTVRHFDFTPGSAGVSTWRVPFGPVSLAIWDNHPDQIERLLVVSRGTHALTYLDRATGDVLDLIELPFEPADLLVHPTNGHAYVSCSGARVVADVNLVAKTVTPIPIPALQPTWMSWGPANTLLVAPLISGNNSTTFAVSGVETIVVDLANLGAIVPGLTSNGLPDEDLFEVDVSVAPAVVRPVSRSAGTILFAQGLNPVSGNHWQLGVESLNRDPAMQTEPLLNGVFALNRLTLTTLPGAGLPPVATHTQVELDDSNPSTTAIDYNPALTIGLPTGLCFASSGFGLACGPTTDNVMVLAPGTTGPAEGALIFEWDLPNGSIPRSVMLDPATETIALVYCWGTNQVLAFGLAPFNPTPLVFDLGFDPAPPAVQSGRAIFYDASRSLNNHLTCGTCHIDGTSDQLAWNLSDKPRDTKGVLHTQTLMGIDRLAPFHWRGERPVLEDFNGAFTGLLGASAQLSPQEFDDFKAYVFSLRSPANIGAHEDRVLDDALAQPLPNGLIGSAVKGQDSYINKVSVGATATCMTCHSLPTGSNNDLIAEVPTDITSLGHMETTAFNELEDKDMPIVKVVATIPATGFSITFDRPLTGFGLVHDSTINSRFDFVNGFGLLTPQDRADVTEFLFQFDSGFGKAVHRATLADAAHPGGVARLSGYLVPQAQAGSCSIAVYGRFPILGAPTPLQWAYRPRTNDFRADLGSVAPVPAATFFAALTTAGATNLCVGLPPGNAEKAAIDYDSDELLNQDELALGTDPFNADTDGDGELDGIEVANGTDPNNPASVMVDSTFPTVISPQVEWVTAKNARITFATSEPCTAQLAYSTPAGGSQLVQTADLEKVHNILATELLPSSNNGVLPPVFHAYSGQLKVTDSSGNSTVVLVNFTSGEFLPVAVASPVSVLENLKFNTVTDLGGGALDVQGSVRVNQKLGGPPAVPLANYVVVANILVDGVISSFTQTTPQPTTYTFDGVAFTALPGPFLITGTTNATGDVSFQFGLTGLTTGQEVRFNVVAVYSTLHQTTAYNPAAPNFGDVSTNPGALNPNPQVNWSFGDTPSFERFEAVVY